tara:strand:+ start:3735 stop:4286 length:552 start_codon:yes stop_codon:yes gene_type:complete
MEPANSVDRTMDVVLQSYSLHLNELQRLHFIRKNAKGRIDLKEFYLCRVGDDIYEKVIEHQVKHGLMFEGPPPPNPNKNRKKSVPSTSWGWTVQQINSVFDSEPAEPEPQLEKIEYKVFSELARKKSLEELTTMLHHFEVNFNADAEAPTIKFTKKITPIEEKEDEVDVWLDSLEEEDSDASD